MSSLTHEGLRSLISYDAESGALMWLEAAGPSRAWQQAGRPTARGYIYVNIAGETHPAHRLIWFYVTGRWPLGDIDHRDGVKGNNRWANLRDVSHAENAQNKRKAALHSRTGLLGVHYDERRRRFVASIRVNGKGKMLGRFQTAKEAQEAYLGAKRELHATCTI